MLPLCRHTCWEWRCGGVDSAPTETNNPLFHSSHATGITHVSSLPNENKISQMQQRNANYQTDGRRDERRSGHVRCSLAAPVCSLAFGKDAN